MTALPCLTPLFLPAREDLAHLGSSWGRADVDTPEFSLAIGNRGTLGHARKPGDRLLDIRVQSIWSAALSGFCWGFQGTEGADLEQEGHVAETGTQDPRPGGPPSHWVLLSSVGSFSDLPGTMKGQPGWAWEIRDGCHGGPAAGEVDPELSLTLLTPGTGLGQVTPTRSPHSLIPEMDIMLALPTFQGCHEAP